MGSWGLYVEEAVEKHFSKVCIIARANYQVIGTTQQGVDIPTAWMDEEIQINENQELLNDWKDTSSPSFFFFGKKFNVILRDDEKGEFIVSQKGEEFCMARQFRTIWFVVYGLKKDDIMNPTGHRDARTAFAAISRHIWGSLEEAGV